MFQYSDGETNPKYPRGFYAFDLNSTHGTFVNKKRIKSNQHIPVNVDSIIKFGLSSRIYVLHGPKPVNNSDDLNINLTHEQMKMLKEKHAVLALKLRVRKELEEEEAEENDAAARVQEADWGMKESVPNEEQDNADAVNPFSVIDEADESSYASDPRKTLKNYFDREGDELEYEMEELGPAKFKCSIRLPITNKFGQPIYAEASVEGKKKECMAACALEACRILNSEGVLKQSHKEKARRQQQKDWESNDFYDSDEDNYLDRTGDIEKKRLMRMEKAGKLQDESKARNKAHTFDSIQADIQALLVEKSELDTKLDKCKAISKAVNDADLDSYIESLKVGTLDTVTRAKLRRRLVEIKMELNRLDKLLNVAKPKDFNAESWKAGLINKLEAKVVVETPVAPVVVEVVVPATETVQLEVSEISIEKPLIKSDIKKRAKPKEENLQLVEKSENFSSKKCKKNAESIEFEEYADSKDYAVWLPPTGTWPACTIINAFDYF